MTEKTCCDTIVKNSKILPIIMRDQLSFFYFTGQLILIGDGDLHIPRRIKLKNVVKLFFGLSLAFLYASNLFFPQILVAQEKQTSNLINMETIETENGTRVILKFDEGTDVDKLRFKTMKLNRPPRLLIVFLDPVESKLPGKSSVNKKEVKEIRLRYIKTGKKDRLDNISMDLVQSTKFTTEKTPGTLVICLGNAKAPAAPAPYTSKIVTRTSKKSSVQKAEKETKKVKKQAKPATNNEAEKKLTKAINNHIKQGKKHYSKKRYTEAIAEWNKAVELDPDNGKYAKRLIKKTQKKVEKTSKKTVKIEDPLLIEPPEVEDEDTQGIQSDVFKLGSIEPGRTVQATVPSSAKPDEIEIQVMVDEEKQELKEAGSETYLEAGNALYAIKKYDEAIKEFQKALDIDPDSNEASRMIQKARNKLSKQKSAQVSSQERAKIKLKATTAPAVQKKKPEFKAPVEAQRLLQLRDKASSLTSLKPSIDILTGKATKAVDEADISEPAPLTLEQCITIARLNNPTVRIGLEEVKLARLKEKSARLSLRPTLDILWKETRGTTTGQDFEGREFTFEFQKPLTAAKQKFAFLQARLNTEVARRNFQKELVELDFKVEQAYFILANSYKDVAYFKKLFENVKKDEVSAETRYKMELSRKLETLKAQSLIADISYKLHSSEKDLILAELTLRQALESRSERPFIIDADLRRYGIATTIDECEELALSNRADLSVDRLMIDYSQYGRKIAKADEKWNVNLEGSVGYNGEAFISESLDMTSEWFVGVKVSKPFGNNTLENHLIAQDKVPSVGQTTSTEFKSNTLKWYFWNNTVKQNITEADVKYLKSIDTYKKKKNSVIFEVRKNYFEYLKSIEQLESNLKKIELQEEQLKIYEARAQLNESTIFEVLDSKDKLVKAKIDFGQAITGYYTAIANLNKAIGVTDYFDLKKGIIDHMVEAASTMWMEYINPESIRSFAAEIRMEKQLPKAEWTKNYSQLVDKLRDARAGRLRTPSAADSARMIPLSEISEQKTQIQDKVQTGFSMPQEKEMDPEKIKNDVNRLIDEGKALYRDGAYQTAYETWENALTLDPENSRIKRYMEKARNKMTE
ncbi:MAG: TolC family protein [Candidatus Theseobacter exili]|nr:TolC family protein [Candidatus Theseobacter exili]